MTAALLFAGLSLVIVCLVFTDCQAQNRAPDAKKSPKNPGPRD